MFDIIGNHIQTIESTISLITILAGAIVWLHHTYSYKKITLSCGSFKVRRKFMNTAALTVIVSDLFYDGGQVPGEIRKEILEITKVKGVKL